MASKKAVSECEARLTRQIAELWATVKSLQKDRDALQNDVALLKSENAQLRQQVQTNAEQNQHVEDRAEKLENQSRRSNLVFYGVPARQDQESWDQCKETLSAVIKEKMGVKEPVELDRVHRVGKPKEGQTRPIIAKFLRWQDTEKVKKQARELEGTQIAVSEDYSWKVRQQRKHLVHHAKETVKQRRQATWTLRYNKLFLDGKTYTYDLKEERVKESVPWRRAERRSNTGSPAGMRRGGNNRV